MWKTGEKNMQLRIKWPGVRVSPGAPYFQRFTTLLKIRLSNKTSVLQRNYEYQGGNRFSGLSLIDTNTENAELFRLTYQFQSSHLLQS